MILSSIIGDLSEGLLSGLAYGAVGVVMLVIGWVVVDLLTPGKLSRLITEDHNWNAAAMVASNLVAIGAIVSTAIWTSHDEFAEGMADAIGYGLLGVLLQAVAFFVVDRLTPGHLGKIIETPRFHPATLISVSASLAMGAVIAAAIA